MSLSPPPTSKERSPSPFRAVTTLPLRSRPLRTLLLLALLAAITIWRWRDISLAKTLYEENALESPSRALHAPNGRGGSLRVAPGYATGKVKGGKKEDLRGHKTLGNGKDVLPVWESQKPSVQDLKVSAEQKQRERARKKKLRKGGQATLSKDGQTTKGGQNSGKGASKHHGWTPKPAKHTAPEWKVPLEAHVMSKCPDASDCLIDLLVPVMSSLQDASQVNLTLSYIGQATDPDGGVSCRHGPEECLGNILQLCAQKLYSEPTQWLGFAMCTTRQWETYPAKYVVQECAAEYGLSFDKLNDCASREDGSYGVGLLRDSVLRTKKAGVTLSCTVRLNEKTWCVRDGGEWKDCENGSKPETLAKEIQRLYNERNGR